MKRYLTQAPTMIVIAISGFAAWSALAPEQGKSTASSTAKPPEKTKGAALAIGPVDRDPFQVARPPGSKPVLATGPVSTSTATPKEAKSAVLAEFRADEDEILGAMKLGGTFIDGREQIAIIDGKVYARGDQLRKADGSAMPYMLAEVRKGYAVLRRGRRDFVLGFSDKLRSGTSKGEPAALAKAAKTPGNNPQASAVTAGRKKDARGGPGSGGNAGGGGASDPASMLVQLLTGAAGGGGGSSASNSSGGGASSNPLAALGNATGGSASGSGIAITPETIQAGLNALKGAYDNIGRDGSTGGTTP